PFAAGGFGEIAGVDVDGFGVVLVHVLERVGLGGGEGGVGAGEQVGCTHGEGLAKAAIEAGADGFEADEAEIAEIGVKLGLGLVGEIARRDAGVVGAVAFEDFGLR